VSTARKVLHVQFARVTFVLIALVTAMGATNFYAAGMVATKTH
jgi:hypothetical protein